jgi:hypothetical protein
MTVPVIILSIRGGIGGNMNIIKISESINYNVERNVFVHTPTGYIISSDAVLLIDFDELSERMHTLTKTWLSIDNYTKMREFISNVETLYT